MKKILSILVLIGYFLCVTGYVLAGDVDDYNKAVYKLNNYEIESGLQEMNKVIYSNTASDDLKAKAYFWISFIQLFDGKQSKAKATMQEMLNSSLGLDYDFSMLPAELSQNTQLKGIYDKEKKKYDKDKVKIDKKVAAYLNKAERYFIKNDYEKSKEQLENVLSLKPNNKEALSFKIKLTQKLREVGEIRDNFNDYFDEAKNLYTRQELERAEELVELILEASPGNNEAADLRGRIRETRRRMKEVRENLGKHIEKSQRLFEKGDYLNAKEELKSVLEVDPGNKEAITLVNKIQMAELKGETIKGGAQQTDVAAEFNLAETYNKAISQIRNYEMETANQMLQQITNTKSALKSMQARSYLWIAFIDLFDGDVPQARKAIKTLLENELYREIEMKDLEDDLVQNVKLMKIYDEEKQTYLKKYKLPKEISRGLLYAKRLFLNGDLENAKSVLDRLMEIMPDNEEILGMSNKVQKVREMRVRVRQKLVEEFFNNARYYFNSGKMMFTMEETNKALKFNPKFQKAYNLFQQAYSRIQDLMRTANTSDKKKFQKAVNYYLAKEYNRSAEIIRKLHRKYPQLQGVLAQTLAYRAEHENQKRAEEFYRLAVKALRKGQYHRAQEHLLIALMMDKYYLDALILMEEVNVELKSGRN